MYWRIPRAVFSGSSRVPQIGEAYNIGMLFTQLGALCKAHDMLSLRRHPI